MQKREDYAVLPEWMSCLTERQVEQVFACRAYVTDHAAAHLPGDSLMILVARLSEILFEAYSGVPVEGS